MTGLGGPRNSIIFRDDCYDCAHCCVPVTITMDNPATLKIYKAVSAQRLSASVSQTGVGLLSIY